jgi:hypothetical protein
VVELVALTVIHCCRAVAAQVVALTLASGAATTNAATVRATAAIPITVRGDAIITYSFSLDIICLGKRLEPLELDP